MRHHKARPKGFEPLTFWLGVDYTLTVRRACRRDDGRWVMRLFCDQCGADLASSNFGVVAAIHARNTHDARAERAA